MPKINLTCKACEGSGKSSAGGKCFPCNGTGKYQPTSKKAVVNVQLPISSKTVPTSSPTKKKGVGATKKKPKGQ
jgi:DnaJ-class molecular chaperone